ncbi:nuclear transport factor 2 family protein [Corynebacterium sp. YIM 101645]|uniref:Nuclear transport factor 2 family protein n=1 Tax=Corynebacterium lemuris TaxID=1859292 RepID=A0ABT2FUR9_9CORY|nr:nuclear transport factor 2 family protein [Corynebacterium lemuris]MCS5478248.1 nuclear transport factor 2 family protein [Corynebacterium lemuris]
MSRQSDSGSARDALVDLEQRRYRMLLEQDFSAYAALCHPDLVFLHATGDRESLDSFIRKNSSGGFRYLSAHHPVDTVTLVGGTAVVVGDLAAELLVGEEPVHLNNRVLATWVRGGDDGWLLLAHMAVPLPGNH